MIGEKMSADAIKTRIDNAFNDIETMFIGVITSVDPVRMRYGVQQVLHSYDTIDRISVPSPILFECPMMTHKTRDFYIRIPYAVGDMVYLGISKEAIDEAITSATPHDNRNVGFSKFRPIDAVILGGILSEEEPVLSSDNQTDFLIQNRKTNCKMVMLEGGGFEFITDFDITTKSKNVTMDVAENFNVKCTNANIEASSGVNITTPETSISGNASVGGNLGVQGGMSGAGDISVSGAGTIGSVTTSSGVTLDGHTHTYNPGPSPPTSTSPGKG